jgi:hypothetical protein
MTAGAIRTSPTFLRCVRHRATLHPHADAATPSAPRLRPDQGVVGLRTGFFEQAREIVLSSTTRITDRQRADVIERANDVAAIRSLHGTTKIVIVDGDDF